jgi:hypothetical protein
MSAQLLLPCEFNQAEADRAAAVQERECLIAHLSEMAAEAVRLNVSGASVRAEFGTLSFELIITSPLQTGPIACRVVECCSHGVFNRLIATQVLEPYSGVLARTPSHRFTISYNSPLPQAEPVIEQIFRHLALIEQNLNACRVLEVH